MARVRKRGDTWSFEIAKNKKHPAVSKSGFKTRKLAEKEARRVEVLLEEGRYSESQVELTLGELFDKWLTVEIEPQNLDIETKKRYRKRKKWIDDYFGDILVTQILRSQYQMFLNKYGEHYEINEVGRMNANIQKAVEFAKADLLDIDDRFLLNIKLNSQKRPKDVDKKYLHSRSDYDRVIEYLLLYMDYRKSVVPYIIYFQFEIGLRPGETLALTWPDIDFENQEVYTHSRWSSSKHKIVPAKNDHLYRKLNRRNPSVRRVPVSFRAMQVFRELKEIQDKILNLLGLENPDQFVFFQIGAKWPVPDESTLNSKLKKILKELKIEPLITVYGARHTYGSVKVQEGVPLEVLAKWFGHKDTSTLRETYIHLLEETRDEWFEWEKNRVSDKTSDK